MKIISFAWTTPALLAGAKTVTRRAWTPKYAMQFKAGDLVAAYDRSPRWGGKKVATIRLTVRPYPEDVRDAPESDYEAEGLKWMQARGIPIQGDSAYGFWVSWRQDNPLLWVVRFELESTEATG